MYKNNKKRKENQTEQYKKKGKKKHICAHEYYQFNMHA